MKHYNITCSNKQNYVWFRIAKAGTRSMINLLHQNTEIDTGFPLSIDGADYGYNKPYKPEYHTFFKFTIVRNPWSRLLSAWKNKVQDDWGNMSKFKLKYFEQFQGREFSFFVKNFKTTADDHLKIQLDAFDQTKIDFIGKLENLGQDFDIICDKIGIPREKLPRKNATKHKRYTEYYDDETREIVAQKYAKDIEYFGYKFGE